MLSADLEGLLALGRSSVCPLELVFQGCILLSRLKYTHFVGSGYFLEEHTPADLARVLYKEQLREIEISPNKDGDLLVSVHDLCLTSDSRAVATVHLAGVHSVHLQVRDKVGVSASHYSHRCSECYQLG